MVWVGWDLTDNLVPMPPAMEEHLPLDQVAQSPIQPGLEHFQGRGIHNFSGHCILSTSGGNGIKDT